MMSLYSLWLVNRAARLLNNAPIAPRPRVPAD
jgi:hypothetical protein